LIRAGGISLKPCWRNAFTKDRIPLAQNLESLFRRENPFIACKNSLPPTGGFEQKATAKEGRKLL